MNILITGTSGFLGSHLLKKLQACNHHVLSLSYRDAITDDMEELILNFQPDVTIHFAWWGGNSSVDADNPDQFSKNLPTSIRLVNTLRRCKRPTRFIGIGSGAEYGKFTTRVDEFVTERPITMYGMSKLLLKTYSESLCNINNMEWMWVRPMYTYGPDDVKTRFIPTLIAKLSNNEDIQLDNCSNRLLDYLYIDDFVDALYKMIMHPTLDGGVYNICSGNEYNVLEIVTTITKLLGSTSNISFNTTGKSESLLYVCGQNEKIIRAVNWFPNTSLTEGLLKTIKSYKGSV